MAVATSGTVRAEEKGHEAGRGAMARGADTRPLVYLAGMVAEPASYRAITRVLDVVIGSLTLVLALPLIAVIAVLVRLDSPGPAIFARQRVARYGATFRFYKFRTMWADSRERFPELYAFRFTPEELRELRLQTMDDPRLTRLGRFLRRTSLDELPNLVHVVRGEMTLVGPRPEVPEMLPYYDPDQLVKFAVKPGLTGNAQVTGRGELTFDETVAADLDHCRNRSIRYDVAVLARTVKVVVTGDGAF